MKIAELRDLSDDQLTDELVKLKKEAFNLRFRKASGQLEDTSQVKKVRRSIAQVQTLLGERAQKAGVAGAEPAAETGAQ